MRQTVWIVLVVVALVAGFFGGWLSKGTAAPDAGLVEQIEQLRQQMAELAKASELAALKEQVDSLAQKVEAQAGTAGLKIAYVNAEEVFLKYKGTATAVQQFSEMREEKEKELQNLVEQLQAGEITREEYQRRVEEIQRELQRLDLELTAKIQQEMIAVITEVAQERGYDWVTRKKDVVLYSRAGLMDDITTVVIDRLNAKLEAEGSPGS